MKAKRTLSLLTAVMMLAAMLGGLGQTAAAAETVQTDPYTLSIQNWDFDTGTGVNQWLGLVTSPFWVEVETTGNGGGENETVLFDLYDEVNGHSIEAFCIDVDTGIDNAFYKRINLEDSPYFDAASARKIRAIVNNGVTVKPLAQIASDANAWLKANGREELVNLTGAEALTATQYAIWCFANREDLVSANAYADYYVQNYTYVWASAKGGNGDTYTTQCGNPIVYNQQEQIAEDGTNLSQRNITALAEFLMSVEPEKAKSVAVSDRSIRNLELDYKAEEGGTYEATVNFSVDDQLTVNGDMTLTVTVGEISKTLPLAVGKHSVVLSGVTGRPDVKVEINGNQTVKDVFFFEAEGGRTKSQTLVGIDGCSLPVHAEATASYQERVLNIYKTTSEAEGKKPLANIRFEIWQVATVDEIQKDENFTLPEQITASEAEAYKKRYVTTLTTDAAGHAAFNFTEKGWADGVYMVVEQFNSGTQGTVAPFFVAIPGTAADGATHVYNVTVNPKNTTETGPDIKKDVTEIENDWDSFDMNEIHTWIIRGGVPAGIADASVYTIRDTLDYRLTYQAGSIAVRIAHNDDPAGGEKVSLALGVGYTVSETKTNDNEGRQVDGFTVSLTEAGMKQVAKTVSGKFSDYEIRVYFDAVINGNAVLGDEIPNQAVLDYSNAAGVDYQAKSDIPEVVTGGANILKVDAAGHNPLPGAKFRIARPATDEDTNTEKLIVGGEEKDVVFVLFYDDGTVTEGSEKVTEAVSDGEGKLTFHGLAYGTYYIVETKAPAGYNLLANPIEVEIDETSHTEAEVITVKNTKFILPETGGMGTAVFSILGLSILAGAAVLLAGSGKKNQM